MSEVVRMVSTAAELAEAAGSDEVEVVEVRGEITGSHSLRLKPGCTLRGAAGSRITFEAGGDGVGLSSDNAVEGVELRTDPQRRALFLADPDRAIGTLRLERVRTVGCIRLLPEGDAPGGHVEVRDVRVLEADARGFEERPAGFGVEIVPAAFTLWNRRTAAGTRITANIRGVSAGSAANPVKGTGVLIAGTSGGGELAVSLFETGEVHSDGGIPAGTPDRISGGVFVVQGAAVEEVRNTGPVTTYGMQDMVLDNWGRVGRWRALAPVTSYGASSIGFVNLGELGTLTCDALMETHGLGSCGFNSGEVKSAPDAPGEAAPSVVAGAVREAVFERIVTRGDGAIGIQVSVPAGRILVRRGIETFGGIGASLARGVVTKLAAIALSVKPGGAAREVVIEGGLTTHGPGIDAIELGGVIEALRVSGAVGPLGGPARA